MCLNVKIKIQKENKKEEKKKIQSKSLYIGTTNRSFVNSLSLCLGWGWYLAVYSFALINKRSSLF